MIHLLLSAAIAAGVLGLSWLIGLGGSAWLGVPALAWCGALALGINVAAFVPAFLKRDERFYDLTGSFTHLCVVTLGVASVEQPGWRGVLALLCVVVWTLRLGGFLVQRIRAVGKDGRFDAIKQSVPRFLLTWVLQGAWVQLNCLAVLALLVHGSSSELVLTDIGFLIWGLGFGLEVVADRQKEAFRARRTGSWIEQGLWARSRHPNYLGEILLWTGLFVVAAGHLSGWGWLAVCSPLFVWLLLTRISGIPLLEARADERWGGDPEYQAFKERVPVLWPRPTRGR